MLADATAQAAPLPAPGDDPFARLYEDLHDILVAHCRRILRDTHAALDAVHETFLRLLVLRPTLPSADDGRRYLLRAATNVCFNVLRRRKAGRRSLHGLVSTALLETAAPEGSYEDRSFLTLLLDGCDGRDREILELRFLEGTNQEEIARRLGCTRRTVYNRLRKIETRASTLLGEAA